MNPDLQHLHIFTAVYCAVYHIIIDEIITQKLTEILLFSSVKYTTPNVHGKVSYFYFTVKWKHSLIQAT